MNRADRQVRYTIERPAAAKRSALRFECASFAAVEKFAKHRLSAPATIIEREQLPLGCEVIARVGTLDVRGKVSWRRR